MSGRTRDVKATLTVSTVRRFNNPASLTRVYACVLTLVVSAHQPLGDMAAPNSHRLSSDLTRKLQVVVRTGFDHPLASSFNAAVQCGGL